MSKKITCVFQVWNSATWIEFCMKQWYPYCDNLVVNEACWVPGDWAGETSPDGSAQIILDFIAKYDTEGKVVFNRAGFVEKQPNARNTCLHLIPNDTDFIIQCDPDEFYFEKDIVALIKLLNHPKFDVYSSVSIPSKNFYFDFTYYLSERFTRVYRWFTGQRVWAIASYLPGNGKEFDAGKLGIEMYHASYVSPIHTTKKGAEGEDLSAQRYRDYHNNVYMKFDGTNLEQLVKDFGGIHPFGHGIPERFVGPYPEILENHPLINKKWVDMKKEWEQK